MAIALAVHLAATLDVYLAAEDCAMIRPHGPLKCCNIPTDALMSCLSQALRRPHLHAVVPAGWMRTSLCCTQMWASGVLLCKAGLWARLLPFSVVPSATQHLPTSHAQVAV